MLLMINFGIKLNKSRCRRVCFIREITACGGNKIDKPLELVGMHMLRF